MLVGEVLSLTSCSSNCHWPVFNLYPVSLSVAFLLLDWTKVIFFYCGYVLLRLEEITKAGERKKKAVCSGF